MSITPDNAALWEAITFNEQGLIPVITQQHNTGEVLMLAWMNRQALEQTIATGQVCYWSRSRGTLWRKGDTSGQTQALKELRLDCDGDALLALVDQKGVACHTGRRRCFYRKVDGAEVTATEAPVTNPDQLYKK